MSQFEVKISNLKKDLENQQQIEKKLAKIAERLETQKQQMSSLGSEFGDIKVIIQSIADDVKMQQQTLNKMSTVLRSSILLYEKAESTIVSETVKKTDITKEKDESQKDTEKMIDEAYKNGKIERSLYDFLKSLSSAAVSFTTATLQNALINLLENVSAENVANAIVGWLRENTTL
ncbi:MAG: hypothetical protein IJ711_05455, partial [Lachnospiraceae bacterium]|nr:hypothetical protein [Lachnospiraceae bacterium]